MVDAILSTYALTQVPGCGDVIADGAAASPAAGAGPSSISSFRPRAAALAQLGISAEWIARRPWEEIRAAMEDKLVDVSWTELFFGTAFLASGRTR